MEEKILRSISLFSELTGEEMASFAAKFRERNIPKNAVLFQEGDAGSDFFVVREGSVRIFISHPDGREITLAVLRPFEAFGELSLIDDLPRSASAMSLEKSALSVLGKEGFFEFLDENAQASRRLLKAAGSLIRRLTDQVHALSFLDVRGRVAGKILELWEARDEEGRRSGVPFNLTHQELAAMIGSTRETVTRTIGFLEEKKIIAIGAGKLQVLLPGELEKLL